jgi:3-oxoacyl-[acyl-carrier protein] reductase
MAGVGKVALITGAGRGIGKALALAFGQAGYAVTIASTTAERNDAVAGEIRQSGGEALPLTIDVTDEQAVRDGVKKAVDTFGRVDVLINNAGLKTNFVPTEQRNSLKDLDPALWRRMLDVNATGAFLSARECIPTMMANGGGAIINISTGAGVTPRSGQGVYAVSKAALNMLNGILALELKDHNISVNALIPGFTVERPPANRPQGSSPLKTGTSAPLCLFLAQQDPIEVTGQIIDVLKWNEEHGFGGEEAWSIFAP